MGTQGLMPWAHKGRCTAAWQARLLSAKERGFAAQIDPRNLQCITYYTICKKRIIEFANCLYAILYKYTQTICRRNNMC